MDILFTGNSISADETTITFIVQITNRGLQPIMLDAGSLDMAAQNDSPLSQLQVDPIPPVTIALDSTISLEVTFPNPGPPAEVLRILDQTMAYDYL
jgi:hypothetical protein